MSYSSKNPYGNKTLIQRLNDSNKVLFLAKIHMVTKLNELGVVIQSSLILAKIHMVTKLSYIFINLPPCLILAKIHMVTKLCKTRQK